MGDSSGWLIPALLVAIPFAAYLYWRMPDLLSGRAGRLALLGALLIMPGMALVLGVGAGISKSSERTFCASCHEMVPYEKSLLIDDKSFLPAAHFQSGAVSADNACYACHTDYTLYGGLEAKMNGLAHVWVHYLGDVPEMGKIELYAPYPNANCLKCHQGTRKFEAVKSHAGEDAGLERLYANEVSCLIKGCHDLAHEVGMMADLDFWEPTAGQAQKLGLDLALLDKLELPKSEGGGDDDLDDLFDEDEDDNATPTSADDIDDMFDEDEPSEPDDKPAGDAAGAAADATPGSTADASAGAKASASDAGPGAPGADK